MYTEISKRKQGSQCKNSHQRCFETTNFEALLGVLGIRYIYPKYFSYKVLVNIDFWV